MGAGRTSSNPAPMRASRLTARKTSLVATVRRLRAPCAGGCAVPRARNGKPGRACPPWWVEITWEAFSGSLLAPGRRRAASRRRHCHSPARPRPTTTAGQLPAPTGPSRHADPGPPRRNAQNSGQITTIAVHPALARPALPSPQGLSTPRPAATRPPPERASGGGHRASVCVALVKVCKYRANTELLENS